jgi:hypothetical protein
MPCRPQCPPSAAAAAVHVTADAADDAQQHPLALPLAPGVDELIRSSAEAPSKRLHSPTPSQTALPQAASPAAPAAKRQLVPPGLSPPSLPPSPPSSPPSSPPLPSTPTRSCSSSFIPRQLIVKPPPLPKPPLRPNPPSRPHIYVCPSCPSISLLPPSCTHPFYSVAPAEPDYCQALSLFTHPPF